MKKWDQFCYIGLIIVEERILFEWVKKVKIRNWWIRVDKYVNQINESIEIGVKTSRIWIVAE